MLNRTRQLFQFNANEYIFSELYCISLHSEQIELKDTSTVRTECKQRSFHRIIRENIRGFHVDFMKPLTVLINDH